MIRENDDLDAVRALGDVPGPSVAVLERAREQLRTHLPAAPAPRGRPSRVRRHAVLMLAAAAATAAAVAAPALPLGPGHRPVARADAATFLTSVADKAGAQQADWKDAAFWYSRSRGQQSGEQVWTRQIWLGHREPGRIVSDRLDGGAAVPLDGPARFGVGGGDSTDWDGLWSLPTDPAALEKVLRQGRRGTGADADSQLFVAVGDLLRESPAPPALRAALYRVAARVPGVTLVGQVTDREGRAGVAVERTGGNGSTTRYVVDPADGRLLQEEERGVCEPVAVGTGPQAPAPAAPPRSCTGTYWTTYLQQGPVADDRSRP
jgi:hypothetical protein